MRVCVCNVLERMVAADMHLNPNILEHLFKAQALPVLALNCVFSGAETRLQLGGITVFLYFTESH